MEEVYETTDLKYLYLEFLGQRSWGYESEANLLWDFMTDLQGPWGSDCAEDGLTLAESFAEWLEAMQLDEEEEVAGEGAGYSEEYTTLMDWF